VQHKVVPAVRQHVAKPRVPHADKLFEAATYGNVNLIGRLLQQGINVNIANNERETALHMAAANGHYSAVIYLINHGANIHSRTIKNWLPIHHAARFRKANIANYLVQKGSSPHARTSDGLSAIDMVRTVGDQQLLRIFGAR
jgi:ankyrin repeat protein